MTSKTPEQDVTLPHDVAEPSAADASLAKPKRTRKVLASAEPAQIEAVEVVVKPKRLRKVLQAAVPEAVVVATPVQATLALEESSAAPAEQSAEPSTSGTLRVRKPRKSAEVAPNAAPFEANQIAVAPALEVATEPSSPTLAGKQPIAPEHTVSDAPAQDAEQQADGQENAQGNERKASTNDRPNNRQNNQRNNPRNDQRDNPRENPRNAARDQNAAPRKPRPVLPPVDTGALFSQVVSGEFDAESITPSQQQDLQAFQEFEVLQDGAQSEQTAASLDATQRASNLGQVPNDQSEISDAAEATEPGKRVLQAAEEAPKLQKLLAQIGVASRRDIEEMIAAGRISVNGAAAHVGQRILHSDLVRMDGKPLRLPVTAPKTRIMLYHKPTGEVCTTRDPDGRPTVFANLPQLRNSRWVSVGRLDINTEGLLVFTTNGELANRLMHPRHEIEREYAVRILGEISEEVLQKLKTGVQLEDGVASFTSIDSVGGEGINRWYRVVIQEGRNREVRRMFEAVGYTVSRLIRVRYANLPLPTILKRGQWAELDRFGVDMLLERVGLATTQQQAQSPQAEASRVQHEEVRNKRRRRSSDRGGSRERNRSQPAQGNDNAFNAQTDGGAPFNANSTNAGHYAAAPKPVTDYDDDHQPGDVNGNTMSNNGYGNSRAGYAQLGELAGRNGGRPRNGGGGGGQRNRNDGGGARQPDPLKTTFGYVQHNPARSGGGNTTGGSFGGSRNNQGSTNNRNAQGGNRGRSGQGGGTGTGGQGGGQGGANNANRGGRGGRGGSGGNSGSGGNKGR